MENNSKKMNTQKRSIIEMDRKDAKRVYMKLCSTNLLNLSLHPSVAGNAFGFALSSYPIRRQDICSVFNELYPCIFSTGSKTSAY